MNPSNHTARIAGQAVNLGEGLPYHVGKRSITDDDIGVEMAVLAALASSPCEFAVGCVLTDADGKIVSIGHRFVEQTEIGTKPRKIHAEEVALYGVNLARLRGGTAYVSLEPCSNRSDGRTSCVKRLIDAGIARVVFLEPDVTQTAHTGHKCESTEILREAGINVVCKQLDPSRLLNCLGVRDGAR